MNSLARLCAATLRLTCRVPLPWVLLACLSGAVQAQAAGPEIFRDADLPLGEKLMAEHRCTACHQAKTGGNPHAIYRPQGRINTPGLLRGMVEHCNTELNLGL